MEYYSALRRKKFCSNTDGLGGPYAKCNKSDR